MVQRKEKDSSTPRTFVKKDRGTGEVLTRTVTSVPASEVEARFDGFLPEDEAGFKAPAASTTTAASKPAAGSSSS